MPRPPRRPHLSPTTAADDGALSDAIDEVLKSDSEWQTATEGVRRAQERLRAATDDEGWRAYLKVEAATNERMASALLIVARWAFEAGRRAA